jgi:hypothetical protein
MKRLAGFFVFGFGLFVFTTQLFASGGCEVTITNKTGTVLEKMVVVETVSQQSKTRDLFFSLKDDKSTSITLKENVHYDIYFVDDRKHYYRKKNCTFTGETGKLTIGTLDFSPNDLDEFIKWLLGE